MRRRVLALLFVSATLLGMAVGAYSDPALSAPEPTLTAVLPHNATLEAALPPEPTPVIEKPLTPQYNYIAISVDRGEGSSYRIGETIRVCYSVPRAGNMRILKYTSAGTSTVLSGRDDGAGGCFSGATGAPTGQHTLRIEMLDGGGESAQTYYYVDSSGGGGSIGISVDRGTGSTYRIGDTIRLCYTVPRAGNMRILKSTPDGTTIWRQGRDDGRGDCVDGTVGAPSGQHMYRIEMLEGGNESASTYFNVMSGSPSPGTALSVAWKASAVFDNCSVANGLDDYWAQPGFNDSAWASINLPDHNSVPGHRDRYYRGRFTLPVETEVQFQFASDDGMLLYIDGELQGGNSWSTFFYYCENIEGCFNRPGSCGINYNVAPVYKRLGPGTHTIGIHLANGPGGSYVDLRAIAALVAPQVSISVGRGEGSTYYVDEQLRLCYSVNRPMTIRVLDCPPGQSCFTLVQGNDDGRGGCYLLRVTEPVGREVVRIQAIENNQVVAQDETFFYVAQRATLTPTPTPTPTPVPRYSISGVVRDDAGNPVSGARVAALGTTTNYVYTGGDGRYTFTDLLPDTYRMGAGKSPDYINTPDRYVMVPPNQTGVDFTLQRVRYSISGTVRDDTGNPVSGATVAALGNTIHYVSSDSNGRYTFTDLLPDTYRMGASKTPDYTHTPDRNVTVPPIQSGVDFTLQRLRYSIAGRVTDGAGVAVAGATVNASGPSSVSATAGSDGRYTLPNLVGGTYTVSVSKAGYTSSGSRDVTLPPNQSGIDFTLQAIHPTVRSVRFGRMTIVADTIYDMGGGHYKAQQNVQFGNDTGSQYFLHLGPGSEIEVHTNSLTVDRIALGANFKLFGNGGEYPIETLTNLQLLPAEGKVLFDGRIKWRAGSAANGYVSGAVTLNLVTAVISGQLEIGDNILGLLVRRASVGIAWTLLVGPQYPIESQGEITQDLAFGAFARARGGYWLRVDPVRGLYQIGFQKPQAGVYIDGLSVSWTMRKPQRVDVTRLDLTLDVVRTTFKFEGDVVIDMIGASASARGVKRGEQTEDEAALVPIFTGLTLHPSGTYNWETKVLDATAKIDVNIVSVVKVEVGDLHARLESLDRLVLTPRARLHVGTLFDLDMADGQLELNFAEQKYKGRGRLAPTVRGGGNLIGQLSDSEVSFEIDLTGTPTFIGRFVGNGNLSGFRVLGANSRLEIVAADRVEAEFELEFVSVFRSRMLGRFSSQKFEGRLTQQVKIAGLTIEPLQNSLVLENGKLTISATVFNTTQATITIDPSRFPWVFVGFQGAAAVLGSPATLHMYDAQGRHIGPNTSGGIDLQIPGGQYSVLADGKQLIYIPNYAASAGYRVVMRGTGTGSSHMQVVVADAVDGQVVDAEYTNVPTTPQTQGTVTLGANATYGLAVDSNGDGQVDTTIAPDSMNYSTLTTPSHRVYIPLVERAGTPSNADREEGRSVQAGQEVRGQIMPASDIDTLYFDARAGQRVTIGMAHTSGDLDSYLTLYAPDGREIARDDDSGEGYDALMSDVWLPQTGRYRIRAQSYNFATSGNYILSVRLQP